MNLLPSMKRKKGKKKEAAAGAQREGPVFVVGLSINSWMLLRPAVLQMPHCTVRNLVQAVWAYNHALPASCH
jgi:hypothetical protein